MSHAWEKFYMAIHSLVGPGSQRERLVNAYVYNIIYVKPEEVPAQIQDDLREFEEDINRVEGKDDEGSVQATVDAMDDAEVDRMIRRIISMYDKITRHEEPFI